MIRFIAHVTDAFHAVHRVVVDGYDKRGAVKDAIAQVPRGVTASIRREDPPHTVAGEIDPPDSWPPLQ